MGILGVPEGLNSSKDSPIDEFVREAKGNWKFKVRFGSTHNPNHDILSTYDGSNIMGCLQSRYNDVSVSHFVFFIGFSIIS